MIRRGNQLIVVLVAAGLVALVNDLHARWIVLSAVLLTIVAAGRFGDVSRRTRQLTAELGLLLVPLFAMLGIDVVIAQVTDRALPPLAGLLLGAVLVFGIAYIYAKPLGEDHTIGYPYVHAIAAVLILIVIPTGLVAVVAALRGDGDKLDRRETISQLDVVVLCACDTRIDPGPVRLKGWSVRTWTGRVSAANAITWDGGEVPPPVQRDDSDRVVLLKPGRNANPLRWAGLAARAEVPQAATYALLDGPSAEDRDNWRTVTRASGGGIVDITRLAGRSTAELGLRAAALSPTADTDLALADDHRPVLLFDTHEPVPRPLDVDQLLATGLIRMCGSAQKLSCAEVDGADGLRTGYDHLSFSTEKLAHADVATTIYVNVTRSGNDARNAIYLDYWWYLPDNPARAGSGAFCGPGFTIGGTTCFDHQSDWEGVTVVLDGDRPDAPPLAVNYAQHTGSVRYSWAALTRLWSGEQPDGRPLVHIARGTHAAYPRACTAGHCAPNPVPGIRDDSDVEDKPHDGRREWSGNACTATCLTALPTRQEGSEPASWAAWDGVWGTANCVLGVVCSSTQPPASPGRQKRFEKPWCVAQAFDFDGTRFHRSRGSCPPRRASADALTAGRTLLALGDSYSSGEGAGAYDTDSARPGNTCHRSPRAWPILLAQRERMTPLPSLACSGAVVKELLTGRPHAQEERTLGQVPRITGDPAMITITIGGNDVGFAGVLKDCIAHDCIATYHHGVEDVLDDRITALGGRLPDAYRAVQAAAPRARVVVTDYPRLFPAEPVRNCAAGGQISVEEAQYLNQKQTLLDQTVIAAAHEAGVESVDVSEAFAGHELRCGASGYLNPLRLGSALRSGSFHPNARGHERLAQVIARALG